MSAAVSFNPNIVAARRQEAFLAEKGRLSKLGFAAAGAEHHMSLETAKSYGYDGLARLNVTV